jgi:hypothetical protein
VKRFCPKDEIQADLIALASVHAGNRFRLSHPSQLQWLLSPQGGPWGIDRRARVKLTS